MNAVTKVEAGLPDVLRYDRETGEFFWRTNRGGGAKAGDKAGTVKRGGYVQIHALGKLHYAHRLAWLFVYGEWPNHQIDHIDGNPSNNRITNLRDIDQAANLQNQRRAHISNKSSGVLGVSFDSKTGKWLARISLNGKTKNLGRFTSTQAAHSAYVDAKRQLHRGAML